MRLLLLSASLGLLFQGDDSPEALVKKLSAPSLGTRERASAALLELGEKALPALGALVDSKDPNVRERVRRLISRIKARRVIRPEGLRWEKAAYVLEGPYAHRQLKKQKELSKQAGGTRFTETAVDEALRWLARHQDKDGSWKTTMYHRECRKIAPKYSMGPRCFPAAGETGYDVGNTGLALLAFLGRGYTHLTKNTYDGIEYGSVLKKGFYWLMSHQDDEGRIALIDDHKLMYGHAMATIALVENYGMTRSTLFKESAQKAVDFLVAAQTPHRGWRYKARSGDTDTSVTTWATLALKLASEAKLNVPPRTFNGVSFWIESVTVDAYGETGYTNKGGHKGLPRLNANFDFHYTTTAMAIFTRRLLGASRTDPRNELAIKIHLRDFPEWDGTEIDFYYWHFGTLAFFQHDGPTGPGWKAWHKHLEKALVENQNLAHDVGCKRGSWEPVGAWCRQGGRVFATALNALTLETYYRYKVFPEKE